jgi:tetratricopeptide (TPR) repeat protein
MRSTRKQIIFFITFLALTANAYAQTPREQLKQMVEQLQKSPNDNALREKIIKLATSIKPAPAIPENAREPFIMGATVLKKASDPAGASKAVDLFTQALTIAPWFADAYYNRAIARETAGQFESAMDDLKLYLYFKLTDAERREAQDKIYSLKASAQLAANTPQAREAALLQKVEGARFVQHTNINDKRGEIRSEEVYEIRNGTLVFTYRLLFQSGSHTCIYGKCQPGEYVLARGSYRDGAFHVTYNHTPDFTQLFLLRPDGQALIAGGGFYNSNPNDRSWGLQPTYVIPRQ